MTISTAIPASSSVAAAYSRWYLSFQIEERMECGTAQASDTWYEKCKCSTCPTDSDPAFS